MKLVGFTQFNLDYHNFTNMKKIFLIFILCSVSIISSAQSYLEMMLDPQYNFYDVVDSAETYFKTIDKDKKGSGYKPYLRWKYLNESKYAPSGDRKSIHPFFAEVAYKSFLAKQKKIRALNTKWREIGPTTIDSITGHYAVGLGRIEDVYVHKANMNIIYAGTRSGGFYKSTNGGATWFTNITDTLFACGVNAISASPTNADSILINVRNSVNATSHGIYRSINGGATWMLSNFNPTTLNTGGLGTNFQIYKIYYHPTLPNTIYIGTNQGIYKSTDNLATWIKPYTGQITQIEFHPSNPNIMYIYDNASGGANENKILISYNAGNTFISSSTLINNNGNTLFLSTSLASPNNVYAGSSVGFWKSIDSGSNFTFVNAPTFGIRALAVNTFDANKIVSGYVDLQRSLNGGDTIKQCTWWSLGSSQHSGTGSNASAFNNSKVYIHADVNILKCVNGVYFGGSDGYVIKSVDDGLTWTRLAEGLGIRENYCLGTSQSNHYVSICGSQDNGESIVNKNGWIEFYGADGMEGLVHPLNDNWLIGSVQFGNRRRTKDGGLSQDAASPPASDGSWVAPLLNDPIQQMRLYDFTDSVYVSENFGTDWTYKGKPTFGGNITQAAMANNNNNIIFASNGSAIQKSFNAALTWTNTKSNLPSKTISDITFDPNYDSVVAVTYDNFQADNQKIYITTDAGTIWKNITYNLGNMPLLSVVIDHTPERNIYVGAEIGIYVKAMKDTIWKLFSDKLPNVSVRDLEICWGSNTIKAATWGRGLWENSLLNRENFPAIVHVNITNPPTDDLPKASFDQYVTSSIHYTGTINKMYVKYGVDTLLLNNKIDMAFLSDSTWKSISPLPNLPAGTKIYFKVFAIGNNNADTTSTFRFQYTIQPNEYCEALGENDGGNLHIENVTIDNINNTTVNNTYTYYDNPILNLNKNINYTISIKGSTGWQDNDYGAWIDFNGDKIFDKNTENILFKPNNGLSASNTFSLPTSYNGLDTLQMRVRLSYWGANPEPCGKTLGEVEDYAVKLNYPTGTITLIKEDISIYPNPTQDILNIKLGNVSNHPIIISNLNGQIIEVIPSSNKTAITISTKKLNSGIYFIKCGNHHKSFTKE